MSRSPNLGSSVFVAKLTAAETDVDAIQVPASRFKREPAKRPKPTAHPWYRPKAEEGNGSMHGLKPDPEVLAEFLKDTPLATIEAILCAPETIFDAGYGDRDNLRMQKLPSGYLLRMAILALRLERADAAKVAEHSRLTKVIEQLKAERERLGEDLPAEARRNW